MSASAVGGCVCPLVDVGGLTLGGTSLCGSSRIKNWKMFWHLLPRLAIGGQACRLPPISTAEWKEKRILFDEKTGRVWPNAELSERAQFPREYVLRQF